MQSWFQKTIDFFYRFRGQPTEIAELDGEIYPITCERCGFPVAIRMWLRQGFCPHCETEYTVEDIDDDPSQPDDLPPLEDSAYMEVLPLSEEEISEVTVQETTQAGVPKRVRGSPVGFRSRR